MRRVILETPDVAELEKEPTDYDGDDDLAKSLLGVYRVIRERMANGGPGWTPK